MLPDKKRRGALRRIEKLLKAAVPQFSGLAITREPKTGRPHLEASYKHWRLHGARQNEQEFSDGTLRLIGLLWAILEGDSPLLLEEPELSLHEAVVEQLPQILARASILRGRQVIVTTHAEKALDDPGIAPGEVVEFVPTKDDTEARLASDDEVVVAAVKAKLPLGQVVSRRTRPTDIEQLTLQFRSDPGWTAALAGNRPPLLTRNGPPSEHRLIAADRDGCSKNGQRATILVEGSGQAVARAA